MEKNKNNKNILGIVILIIILISGYIIYHGLPERKARSVVDKHLHSIKSGKGNPYSTVDVTKVEKVFINVLDFKYLSTPKNVKVRNDPTVHDRHMYEIGYNKIYKTYEEYLDSMKELYGDRTQEINDSIVVESNDFHYEFQFLYDVTITNKLGNKLYKKYLFDVAPSLTNDFGYEITRFHER